VNKNFELHQKDLHFYKIVDDHILQSAGTFIQTFHLLLLPLPLNFGRSKGKSTPPWIEHTRKIVFYHIRDNEGKKEV